ncbi:FMN-binding protein [Nakamurella sp. PAMC28650]|uniref:FMN-binding protein n=1 Tax=Nakamurella sp. PAMC28650 TaxID=2762325 RepID=UPI00164D575B|nr:FMN-binding protein [Nakamurella sp. PAMC28650]QNK81455.1 FMN-binding protein [Nakamurella sp. PAMC28650]
MRRITFTIVSTLAVLVLLFSYRTSRDQPITATTVAIGQAHVVTAPGSVVSSAAGPDPVTSGNASAATPTTVPGAPAGGSTKTSAPSGRAAGSTASSSRKSTPATPSAARSVTVDGASTDTPYGPVQVEVVIKAGRITDVNAIVYPQGSGRDQEINQYALPQLRSQVLSAQSANVAGVSGATYTSQGFVGSLQSALDQVHFK